ncbi:unnamed protein product [Paramecium primaurelia]|uniref:Uncharacterized protein n=1 Tax=Paramecium primaurelia TaxID=5886 RepID=A0A8S1NLC1_PARPR|nr:unnamed protein product [Paramecium primaurelia]
MDQFLNDFEQYCRNIGILEQESNFEDKEDELGQILFKHILKLNKESLMQLSNRIAKQWLDQQQSQKIVQPNSAKQNNSKRSKHSQSTPQESMKSIINSNIQSTNYLYDQYIQKEENKILKSQKIIEEQLKECTFQPQILKKSQQLDTNIPVHDRLAKFGTDQRLKQQISSEIKNKNDLKQCTFKPQVNHKVSKTLEGDPFSRLYLNALSQRQSKPQSQEKIYSHKPQLISQPPQQQLGYLTIPVEQRLYNNFFDQQQQLVQQQEIEKLAELEECTFTPIINQYASISNGIDNKSKVFERLYNKSATQKSNSEIKEQTQILNRFSSSKQSEQIIRNASFDKSKYVSQFQIEQSPYDRLHEEYKRIQKKKKIIENQVFSSIPFKPKINKK